MGELIQALIPILIAGVGAVAGIKFVSEGERALLLRFDKAVQRGGEYRVIMPGLRFLIPGAHKLARIHVKQRTINFPSQTIVLKDRTVFEVSAVIGPESRGGVHLVWGCRAHYAHVGIDILSEVGTTVRVGRVAVREVTRRFLPLGPVLPGFQDL